jgi:hypothetical protein
MKYLNIFVKFRTLATGDYRIAVTSREMQERLLDSSNKWYSERHQLGTAVGACPGLETTLLTADELCGNFGTANLRRLQLRYSGGSLVARPRFWNGRKYSCAWLHICTQHMKIHR